MNNKKHLVKIGLVLGIFTLSFSTLFILHTANAAICIDPYCGGGGGGGGGGVTPPVAPTLNSVTALSSSMLSVTFTDNSYNETGFYVYRDAALLWSTNSTAGAGTSTTVYDYGLTCGISHSYYVQAYNSAGSSVSSNIISGTPPCPPPPAPVSNSATTYPCTSLTCQDSAATNFNGPLPCAYGNPPPPPPLPTSVVSSTLNIFSRDDSSLYLNWKDVVTSTDPYTFEVQRIKLTPDQNTNFTAKRNTGTLATLSWNNSTVSTPYYISIERSSEPNQTLRFYFGQDTTLTTVSAPSYRPWNGSAFVPQSSGIYADNTLVSGTAYYYRVRACSEITPPYMQLADGAIRLESSKPNPACSAYSYAAVASLAENSSGGVSQLAVNISGMIDNVAHALALVPDVGGLVSHGGESISYVVHSATNFSASLLDSAGSLVRAIFTPIKKTGGTSL